MFRPERRSGYGLVAFLLFLLVQAVDGAFTYFGVGVFGPEVEGNPLIASLILGFGEAGLVAAKLFAAVLGLILYLTCVTRVIVALTYVHLALAVVPWAVVFM